MKTQLSNFTFVVLMLLTLGLPTAAQHHAHDSDEGMHHDFSDAEHWSTIFDAEDRDEWQLPTELVALMGIEKGMTVADLGAGTGYFLPHLAIAVGPSGKVLALEPETNLVEYMEKRARNSRLINVSVRQISNNDPELRPQSVDRILIVNTWHHISHRRNYATKLAEALNPGGAVYIVDFTRDSPSGPPVEDRLPAAKVIEELSAGGLLAEQVDEELPRQYVVVARRAPRASK